MLECAIRVAGRKVTGERGVAGPRRLREPGLRTTWAAWAQRHAVRTQGAEAPAQRRAGGGSGARPPPPAWCAPGRPRREGGGDGGCDGGGGAVCTMSYPGHPGAGGGYYPGGVSAARAGSRPGRDRGTPWTPRGHTGLLRRGGSPGASSPRLLCARLPRPRPLPFGLILGLSPSARPFALRVAAWGQGAGGFWPKKPTLCQACAAWNCANWILAFSPSRFPLRATAILISSGPEIHLPSFKASERKKKKGGGGKPSGKKATSPGARDARRRGNCFRDGMFLRRASPPRCSPPNNPTETPKPGLGYTCLKTLWKIP